MRRIFLTTVGAVSFIVAAPQLAQAAPRADVAPNFAPSSAMGRSDPLEPVNRAMFAVDKKITSVIGGGGGPLKIVPRKMRRGIFNVFSNLDEPVSAANQVLQGKWKHAATSVGRFATNTTVGLLGTRDVATKWGMPKRREDFGQTLAKYGMPSGPYIYLPLLGPSTMRDKLAGQVDGVARPLGWVDAGTVGDQAIGGMENLVQPQRVSIRQRARAAKEAGQTRDEYATLRDLYYAKRAAEIEDAAGADGVPPPRWGDEDDVQVAQVQPPRRGAVLVRTAAEQAAYDASYDAGAESWDEPAYVGADDDELYDPG